MDAVVEHLIDNGQGTAERHGALTDGEASHPGLNLWSPHRLALQRTREAHAVCNASVWMPSGFACDCPMAIWRGTSTR